jgi:hypothetical protein
MRFAAAKDHFDGTREGLGHCAIEARGKGLKRGCLGADKIRRAKGRRRLECAFWIGETHWHLMVTKDRGEVAGFRCQG